MYSKRCNGLWSSAESETSNGRSLKVNRADPCGVKGINDGEVSICRIQEAAETKTYVSADRLTKLFTSIGAETAIVKTAVKSGQKFVKEFFLIQNL